MPKTGFVWVDIQCPYISTDAVKGPESHNISSEWASFPQYPSIICHTTRAKWPRPLPRQLWRHGIKHGPQAPFRHFGCGLPLSLGFFGYCLALLAYTGKITPLQNRGRSGLPTAYLWSRRYGTMAQPKEPGRSRSVTFTVLSGGIFLPFTSQKAAGQQGGAQ